MKVGYVRVSTIEQNTARQEEMMKALNVDKLFIEKISGKNTDRPVLKKYCFLPYLDSLGLSGLKYL